MSRLPVLLLFLSLIGCSSEPAAHAASVPLAPQFTVGSGVTRTDLGQATFDIDKVKRITDKWHVELKAKDGLDIAVRTFTYDPGSFTGWHQHPGPVFIQVVKGTVTFYEATRPAPRSWWIQARPTWTLASTPTSAGTRQTSWHRT